MRRIEAAGERGRARSAPAWRAAAMGSAGQMSAGWRFARSWFLPFALVVCGEEEAWRRSFELNRAISAGVTATRSEFCHAAALHFSVARYRDNYRNWLLRNRGFVGVQPLCPWNRGLAYALTGAKPLRTPVPRRAGAQVVD